jgi:hypothetical protein
MTLATIVVTTVTLMLGMLIPKIDSYSASRPFSNNAVETKARQRWTSPLPIRAVSAADDDADAVHTSSSSSSSSSSLEPAASLLSSSRRHALFSMVVGSATAAAFTAEVALQQPADVVASAAESESTSETSSNLVDAAATTAADAASTFRYELRDRNMNRDAIIREDYWYMLGKNPPRLLSGPIPSDDPQWNAFGTCTTSTDAKTGAVTGNSCTYVSLSLRIPAYSKYAFAISYGAKEYAKLGRLLHVISENQKTSSGKTNESNDSDENLLWAEAASFVQTKSGAVPPAVVDAELKMILLATALLTSPNFPQPGRELLVARYYANEVHFAHGEILRALLSSQEPRVDVQRAMAAWEFGRDSWNSYFQVVNRSIVPKVGDQFEAIA